MAALVLAALPAHATWSVIGTDPSTGEVGVAVAACAPGEVTVVPVLVPGMGAAVSQGNLNGDSGDVIAADLQAGLTAQQVIATAANPQTDPNLQQRQYGVVTLSGTAAAFNGSDIPAASSSQQSADQTASVQGNTLDDADVITESLGAYDAAAGRPLPERLLAALSAGSEAGGDDQCGNRTASSAALLVAKPGDPVWNQTSSLFHVDITEAATPSIFISVVPGGTANPVTVLDMTYQNAAANGTTVQVQQLPWMLRTFGVPASIVWLGVAAVGFVLLIILGVFWTIRRIRRNRRSAIA